MYTQCLRRSVSSIVRAALTVSVLGVTACGGYTPNYDLLARGPSADLNGDALKLVADNQEKVVRQISRLAGFGGAEPIGSEQWAQFGAAAFGRARIECNAYLAEIMKVEEQRRTTNQQLALTGAATAGILGLAGAASMAISITAVAFGLAQGTVDNVSTGLIYSLGADSVQTLIAKLRGAYTEKLQPSAWKDRATSFNLIYGYLELCTPAVLREKIKSAVVKAKADATAPDPMGGPPQVTILDSASVPIPERRPPPPVPNTASSEPGMLSNEVSEIQTTLCQPPTGNPGGLPGSNAPTRVAIRDYLSAINNGADPSVMSDQISVGPSASRLREAVQKARVTGVLKTCTERSFQNAFEVGLLGRTNDVPGRVKLVQEDINAKLDAADKIDVDGLFVTLRKGVERLRKKTKLNPSSNAIDLELYNFIYDKT